MNASAILGQAHRMCAQVAVEHPEDVPVILRHNDSVFEIIVSKADARQAACFLKNLGSNSGCDSLAVLMFDTRKVVPGM